MRAISRCGILARDLDVEDRADHPVIGACAGANGNGVETILRGEGVARLRTAQAGADDAPIRCATARQVVDDDGLMRPVERADAEMNDARRDAANGRRPGGGCRPEAGRGWRSRGANARFRSDRDFSPSRLTWDARSRQCFGQLVRPIFQNWRGPAKAREIDPSGIVSGRDERAARSRGSATPLSPGCRSAARLDRQRRIRRRQPAADRTRSRRTVEGLAADGARSADRARSRGPGSHSRRLRNLCQRAGGARAAVAGVGR